MGRVDEALRRAAEAAAEATPAPARRPAPRLADDIEQLSKEAFPIEIEEHRRPHRPTAVAAAAVAPEPVEHHPVERKPEPEKRPDPPAAPPVAVNMPVSRGISFDRVDSSLAGKVVIDQDISPASREQYRRLAATLHHAQASHGLKVVMVTSALVGEGKTLTASNLALTLSESYKKNVLLIDGDLRRPALHTLFRVESSPGLSEGLTASDDQRLAVRQISPRLGVLTAGRPSADPIASLTSTRMQRVVEEAREAFDWVIIDTPPVALLPDTNLLVSIADGALLVVRAGSTPWDLAQRAVNAVGRDRVLGVVLNHAEEPSKATSYAYDAYAPTLPAANESAS
jgi:protein-tyrosine kinase